MSNFKRWAHTVQWEGLQISAAYMAINDGGEYVMHADYAALEAERDHLKACQENAQLHITGLVAERNVALQQRDKLAELLREVGGWIDRTSFHGTDALDLMRRIDTALSELTP